MRIFLFFLLVGNVFANEYYPVTNDAEYHALIYEVASDKITKDDYLRCATNDEPSDGVLKVLFKSTFESENFSTFDKLAAQEKYINRFREARKEIKGKRKVSMIFKMQLGSYYPKTSEFQVDTYQAGRLDHEAMTCRPYGNKHDQHRIIFILDHRVRDRIFVPQEFGKQVISAMTLDFTAPVRLYGTVGDFTENNLPLITVDKYEILDPKKGGVIYGGSLEGTGFGQQEMKAKRDNVYFVLNTKYDTIGNLFYRGKLVLGINGDRSTRIDKVSVVDRYQDANKTGIGSDFEIPKVKIGEGLQILKIHVPFFGGKKLLVANLPETDENYALIESNDEKAILKAFDQYYKK